ncbi:MBL fold metallo-hydrolase [Bosea minatitlanensis]|uniref:MBL fold metallo-hydrolase n=1 Tax=Bosea minatitlanensis TaxID=128782 RepID=A0ABW0F0F2_9HYPH|nr:MBL fold metallo-hydrolase [Bosea minatitlanensis]MCT4492914.1 MBL fold metallo-hydrolase [Bosea minatitlanensis]
MKLKLLRNATLKLDYGGRTFLIDPDFGVPLSRRSFTGRSQNPMVPLPEPIEDIVAGVDTVIVSHLHADHFDDIAKARLPKTLPVICQPGQEPAIAEAGFAAVTAVDCYLRLGPIVLKRHPARHGTGAVAEAMGPVMGLSFEAPGEPTLYWCGDSVLYPPLRDAIAATDPDVIVSHSGGALWDGTPIIMDIAQTLALAEAFPRAIVVTTHMEALDHCTVSRAALRKAAKEHGIDSGRLRIPADGEALDIPVPAMA